MDKISYSIKVSEEGRPTTLDTRQEEFKPLVEKYERRNMWNSCILIFKNLRSKLLDHLLLGGVAYQESFTRLFNTNRMGCRNRSRRKT